MAINVADLVAYLKADTSDFSAKMQGAAGDLLKIGTASVTVGNLVSGLAQQAISMASNLASFPIQATQEAGKYAEQLDNLRQRTGLSLNALQGWGVALAQNGVELNSFALGMKSLATHMQDVESPTSKAAATFAQLGITIQKGASSEEVINQIADAVSQLPDGFQKSAAMTELFGRAGAQLIPVFNAGREGLAAMKQQAIELGTVLSTSQVEKLNSVDDSWDRLGITMKGFTNNVGSLVAPAVQNIVERLTAALGALNNLTQGLQGSGGAMESFAKNVFRFFGQELPDQTKHALDGLKFQDIKPPSWMTEEEGKKFSQNLAEELKSNLTADAVDFITPGQKQELLGAKIALQGIVDFQNKRLSLLLFENAEGQKGKQIVVDTMAANDAYLASLARQKEMDDINIQAKADEMKANDELFAQESERNMQRMADEQELYGLGLDRQQVEQNLLALDEQRYGVEEANGPAGAIQTQLGTAILMSDVKAREQRNLEESRFFDLQKLSADSTMNVQRAAYESDLSLIRSSQEVKQARLDQINTYEAAAKAQVEREIYDEGEKFTRIHAIEMNALAERISLAHQFPDFWQQQLMSIQQSSSFVWGNIVSTFSSSMAQMILHGGTFKQMWDSLMSTVLQATINTIVQMGARWALHFLQTSTDETTSAALHVGVEGEKTAASEVGAQARSVIALAESKAVIGALGAEIPAVGAIGEAAIGTMEATVQATAGVLLAIATALEATIVGAELGAAYDAAAAAVEIAGNIAIGTGQGILSASIGAATGAVSGGIALASGGIVSGPTQALIGEGGEPEMVAPLSKAKDMGFGGGPTTIVLQLDGTTLAQTVIRKMPQVLRLKLGNAF